MKEREKETERETERGREKEGGRGGESKRTTYNTYGVATIRRLLKIIGVFCKRAL